MNTQQVILVAVSTCVMGVGLWLRTIFKKAFQIMDGHLISIVLDPTVDSQTQ